MESLTASNTVLSGLAFPEGPRWHDDRFWFSDMHAYEVVSVGADGTRITEAVVPNQPSGLGWLPDGRLLVVSMTDRRLLRREADGTLVTHADLSQLASWHCNDMVVDGVGRAYVGNFGWDLLGRTNSPALTNLVCVEPDGAAREVASDLNFPNGCVITPDGATLIVGESGARRLTAFTIAADGSLGERRLWADLPEGSTPDGICLDAEGAVWSACPRTGAVWRIAEGGEVLARVDPDAGQRTYACMLGGEDCRTLFLCVASTADPDECRARRDARIVSVTVDVPGAGLP